MRVDTITQRLRSVALAAVLTIAGGRVALAQSSRFAEFLTKDAGFTTSQWAALDRGDVEVRELPTGDHTDVAVIGIARVARPAAFIIRDARAAGSATARSTAHVFGTPASLADVAALRLTPDEIQLLADCRPDRCNMKLSAADMAALSAIVAAGTPTAPDRATDYLRQRLVDMVVAYRRRGSEGAPVYDDAGSVQSGRSFDAMLRRSCQVCRALPEVTQFLAAYPRATLPGDNSGGEVFWVMDSMPRVRPTLRVMHEFTAAPEPGVTAFVARQVYANHYFEAGLEMLFVVDDAEAHLTGASRGALVVSVRLYHFDKIPKFLVFDLRGRVVDRLEDAVATDLRARQR